MPAPFKLTPPTRPLVKSQIYRDAMSLMASTVCLVATQFGDERLGRTVTSVFSLSADPPIILVSIDMISRLADHIAKTRGFSFAMLAEDQRMLADEFAGVGELEDRFGAAQWDRWVSGHPKLRGAVTAMDCELVGAIETGSHVLFAGAIIDLDAGTQRSPLIWHQRRYHLLENAHAWDDLSPERRA